jgi:hypothetical protein
MKILFDGPPPPGIAVVIHPPRLPETDLGTWIQRTLGARSDADLETSTSAGWPVRLVHGVVDEIHRVGAIYRFDDFVAAVVATFVGRDSVDARLNELMAWIQTGRPDRYQDHTAPIRSVRSSR